MDESLTALAVVEPPRRFGRSTASEAEGHPLAGSNVRIAPAAYLANCAEFRNRGSCAEALSRHCQRRVRMEVWLELEMS